MTTLQMVLFGTQLYSKFEHLNFLGQKPEIDSYPMVLSLSPNATTGIYITICCVPYPIFSSLTYNLILMK